MINVATLRAFPVFADHTDEELLTFLGVTEARPFPAGESIFKQDERAQAAYVVVAGQVEIAKLRVDGSARVAVLAPGAWFGQAALVERAPRTATAIAHTDVIVLELLASRYEKLLAELDPLARRIQKRLVTAGARQLRHAVSRLTEVLERLDAMPDSTTGFALGTPTGDALERIRIATGEWALALDSLPSAD